MISFLTPTTIKHLALSLLNNNHNKQRSDSELMLNRQLRQNNFISTKWILSQAEAEIDPAQPQLVFLTILSIDIFNFILYCVQFIKHDSELWLFST